MLFNQGADRLAFGQPQTRTWRRRRACGQSARQRFASDCTTQQLSARDTPRWQREALYRQQLGARYYGLSEAVAEMAGRVVRASSLVENLNSRWRSCFCWRRQLGPDYLELLKFFLNHRRLQRSEHAARVGQSPAELLSGQEHSHWLVSHQPQPQRYRWCYRLKSTPESPRPLSP
jgi:hypothetical protein